MKRYNFEIATINLGNEAVKKLKKELNLIRWVALTTDGWN
jgi:hypothetical protein